MKNLAKLMAIILGISVGKKALIKFINLFRINKLKGDGECYDDKNHT